MGRQGASLMKVRAARVASALSQVLSSCCEQFVTRVPSSCRAWKWELMLSFLLKLQPPPLLLRADTQEVQSPMMNLVQSDCYPHWKLQQHCVYWLICINNYNSSPHSALPLWVLMTLYTLFFLSFFIIESFTVLLLVNQCCWHWFQSCFFNSHQAACLNFSYLYAV